jgi:hypothetical protein
VLAVLSDSVEAWSNVAANAAQIGAILVGGWWAYNRFVRQRESFPRATLQQVITHRELNDAYTYLRVALKIENTSTVLLPNEQARTDVYQVLPLSPAVQQKLGRDELIPAGERYADWPCIGSYDLPTQGKIEPGDSDEFSFDFVIPTEVTTVYLYSYVSNPTADNLGWGLSSLYDLDTAGGQHTERVTDTSATTSA